MKITCIYRRWPNGLLVCSGTLLDLSEFHLEPFDNKIIKKRKKLFRLFFFSHEMKYLHVDFGTDAIFESGLGALDHLVPDAQICLDRV